MIRKFVQDDHSHSGTPLNPQGSREHQLLGSGYADLLVGDLTGVPSKIQGDFKRLADFLVVPKCVARNFFTLRKMQAILLIDIESSWDFLSAKKQAEELLMVPGGCAEGKEEPQIFPLDIFFGVLQSQPFASESNKKVVQF